MIRLLIVDDQVIVTEGLRKIFDAAPTIEVVGVAYDGAQALEQAGKLKPDIVLMDLKMPGMNGIRATRAIREQYPDMYVLVLTTYSADEWVFDAIRAGASGYLLKDTNRHTLVAAIEGTVEGRTHIDSAVADKLFTLARQQVKPDTTIFVDLTERELTILRYIARGLTATDIAAKLHLADGTIRNNITVILDKLHVENKVQAAALAWHHGLVQRDMSDLHDM
jgi:NarL family two-component system response regulator LiaR